jgi:hypothetical protein
LTLRRVAPVTALVIAGLLAATGCGGTLEGKYRRGELTTTTTRGARTSDTTPATAPTTSTTRLPTGGNAAGQRAQGERGGPGPGGTIVQSAARRVVVPPLGGRHR